ncbi:Snf7 family protein [Tardisphaera miroshnichenkoae]
MASNWEERESFFRKLEEHIRRGPPLKERINHAIYVIQTQKEKLEQMYQKIEERDKDMFGKTVAAMAEGDTAHAAIYANECSELRKMAKVVLASQLALEQVAIRLETVEEFGDLAVAMAPIRAVMADTKSRLAGVVPEVASELEGVNDTLGKALIEVGEAEGIEQSPVMENEEAKKILQEANTVAEQKVKEKFPQIPAAPIMEGEGVGAVAADPSPAPAQDPLPMKQIVVNHKDPAASNDKPQGVAPPAPEKNVSVKATVKPEEGQLAFDRKLLEYIRAHGGELRISAASKDLGVPPAFIKETLEKLSREGKVKLS